ncbi:Anti-sigma-D factor RsdA [Corynebacterium atrinae]|uniref:hypothetical protein n=1 Tax=Corynebacterium atrinae TaxID=1336740 RepID=UPI0025B465B5|nr:hypothetical protein [Corynebacterium atrinae]WJY62583.1 Anti-sigma-D factor RsdA [Corynebacterium atrinae]
MSRRFRDASSGDINDHLQPVVNDDAFLTDLSHGIDPTDGEDELAALFLALRDDVERQMPPAPLIEGADEEPVVISLAERRAARRSRPLLSGLIGAAAATLVIAGSGTAIFNATPGSPLWGISSTLFSDRAAVIELAGTLEQVDSRAAQGDMDGARELISEARKQVREMSETEQQPKDDTTVTATVTKSADPSAPTTVTETKVETETSVATVTVTQGPPPITENPLPTPEPTVPVTTTPAPGTLSPPQTQQP